MAAFSLPKYLILKKAKEFNEIFARGEVVRSQYFAAFFQRDSNLLIGFTAQKGLRNIVTRNKLKRRTRELWRIHFRDYSISGRIILIAKKNAEHIEFYVLEKDFLKLLNKLTN